MERESPSQEADRQALMRSEGSAASAPAPATTAAPAFETPTEPSKGEKWWHWLTYTGVGYFANLGLSIFLADQLMHGRAKPILDKVFSGAKGALRSAGMAEKNAESIARLATNYSTYPLGGHFTSAVGGVMEAHAGYITHELNKMLDPDYKYKDVKVTWDNDEAAPPLANPANKNTAWQIALRRMIGWSSVIAMGTVAGKTGIDRIVEDTAVKGVAQVTRGMGKGTLAPDHWVNRYTRIGAMDSIMTVVTAMITAMTKNTFGESRHDTVSDDALSIDIPGVTENGHIPTPGARTAMPKGQPPAPTPAVTVEDYTTPHRAPVRDNDLQLDGFQGKIAQEARGKSAGEPGFSMST